MYEIRTIKKEPRIRSTRQYEVREMVGKRGETWGEIVHIFRKGKGGREYGKN